MSTYNFIFPHQGIRSWNNEKQHREQQGASHLDPSSQIRSSQCSTTLEVELDFRVFVQTCELRENAL